ncbi:MAG: pirin family protein [Bacteroidota bacterium]
MPIKSVTYLLEAQSIDMGGFPVKQAFPTQNIQQIDPFLLLHHASAKFSSHRPAKSQGVGPHPHRGFSPVTFVVEGQVHHRDSRGNSQIAGTGEVQWMHAGMGIVHSERPSEELAQSRGRQEIVQLWINSPAAHKMEKPEYWYLSREDMPVILSEDQKVQTKLIAGEYAGQMGKIPPKSPLLVMWGQAETGGHASLTIPQDFNSMLYLIKGNMRLVTYGLVDPEHLMVFGMEGDQIEMEFHSEAQFLLLCGKAIEEEVSRYGPYVMNNQTEILEAMRDYQMGKMGILIEEE